MSPERQRHLSQMHSKKWEPALPVHLRGSADHIFCTLGYLPSFSTEAQQYPQGSSLVMLQTSKTSVCKPPYVIKCHKSQPLTFSLSMALGQCFHCAIPCVLLSLCLSLTLLHDQDSLLSTASATHFPPRPYLCTSYFHSVASSLPLVEYFVLLGFRSIF